MRIKLLEPIEGFEEEAEIKAPVDLEPWTLDGKTIHHGECAVNWAVVLTYKKEWRPVRDEEVLKAIRGQRVQARFMHFKQNCAPFYGDLTGAKCVNNAPHLIASDGAAYPFCEVLR
jgi:hypothetical protein